VTRPALHFTPREGWVNDPLGLTYHDNLYHLFFQYVPGQTAWSPECRWGHAVSEDLLTWAERDVALEPGDGDGGCWSGSVVVDSDGRASIFYTSVQLDDLDIGRIRTARPIDEAWDTWRKEPVVATVPENQDAIVFRDPYLFRDHEKWRMLVGSGRSDGTATALAYRSVP
jgi:beta-fructofuranosidase